MKCKILIPVCLLVLGLASCQKEIDWGINGGGGSAGTTLVKTVSKEATDSVVTLYTYDANKRLINVKITGKSQGTDVGNEERIYRNAAGIVTSKTQINAMLAAAGIDSTVTTVYYSTSPARYASKVSGISFFGVSVLDSTVLIYDGAGKVAEEHSYQAIPILFQPYELTLKVKYTYSPTGNLLETNSYSHDASTGADDLATSIKYTYDSKTAAIKIPNDAYAIGHPDWVSVNNATKVDISSPISPAADRILNFAFTYNSNNRPATGVTTQTPGPIVTNLTYFYQ
jgi:hypothetical protein